MAERLEDWSFFDHLRFLARAWYWVLGAGLIAGALSSFIARGQTVTQAEVLWQLGYNPISGWLEPPNELVARLQSPSFLEQVPGDHPVGAIPRLTAQQIPNSGFLRVNVSSSDPALATWALEAATAKVIQEHSARAERSARAQARRALQLDGDIARLRAALAVADGDDPQVILERLRLVQRLSEVERERDDLEPDVKIASPRVTRQVQPIESTTRKPGYKQAIYGAVAGLLLGLTLLYLREGLKAAPNPAQSASPPIE